MKLNKPLLIAAFSCAWMPVGQAELVNAGGNVTEITSTNDIWTPANISDGVHAENSRWTSVANNPDYFNGGTIPVFVLDLGASDTFYGVAFWGYHPGARGNSVTEFELAFSETTDFSGATPITLTTTSSDFDTEDDIAFPTPQTGRYVQLRFLDNGYGTGVGGGDRVGMSEIQFENSSPGLDAPDTVSDTTNGEAIQLTVPVSNKDTVAYNVTGLSYSGSDAADFSDTLTFPIAVPAGGSQDLIIDFTPSGGGLAEALLTIQTDDPDHPNLEVTLSVEVHDPRIDVAASLDFGFFDTDPGTVTETLDVGNLGATTALTLSNPQITGAGSAAYQVTNLPASVPANGADQIEITFTPGGEGAFPAQLTLDTNDPFQATVTVDLTGSVASAGTTVLQYGFDFTSGTVADNGGSVADDSGHGNDGKLDAPGRGNGGTYTADIPTAGTAVGQAQNVTGIGSLDITGPNALSTGTGAFSGEALNGLSAADIGAAGGITYEIWVKNVANVTDNAHLLVLGGMHGIAIDPVRGIGAIYGDNGKPILTPPSPIDTTEWTHIAITMATTDPDSKAFTNISLYVNGVLVAEDSEGHTFPWFLTRGAGIGKHPVLDSDDADGLVYEPRISAGILDPSDFTVVPPPPGIFAPAEFGETSDGPTGT